VISRSRLGDHECGDKTIELQREAELLYEVYENLKKEKYFYNTNLNTENKAINVDLFCKALEEGDMWMTIN
jgi:hypothetical protein